MNFLFFKKISNISLPVKMIIAVVLAFILGIYSNNKTTAFFYTISLFLKDLLILAVPLMIFGYLGSALLEIKNNAFFLILGIFLLVIIANGINIFYAYFLSLAIFEKTNLFQNIEIAKSNILSVNPYFVLPFKLPFSCDYALMAGVLIGFIAKLSFFNFLNKIVETAKKFSINLFSYLFIPLLPIYVFGFVMKLSHEGQLTFLAKSYSKVFVFSIVATNFYIFLIYLIASCNLKKSFSYIKNMIPAWITGFSTMSSAVSLPVTIQCVQTNNKSKLIGLIAPFISNSHLIGDGINLNIMALFLLTLAGLPIPDFIHFLPYVGAYLIAKFSGSGVPGGGTIVLIPLIENHLGLESNYTSILITVCILQDSLTTASNIMGNGALAIIAEKIFSKFSSKKLIIIMIATNHHKILGHEILGHDKAIDFINKTIDNGVHHSFLINGSWGIGKFGACRKILNNYMTISNNKNLCNENLILIKKDDDKNIIGIDELKELLEDLNYKTLKEQKRFVLIDSLADLNVYGFNKLLKIIEEPYPNTIFLCIDHNDVKLPLTIKSRLIKVFFKPLEKDLMLKLFPKANNEDLLLAQGSPGFMMELEKIKDLQIFYTLFKQNNLLDIKEFAKKELENYPEHLTIKIIERIAYLKVFEGQVSLVNMQNFIRYIYHCKNAHLGFANFITGAMAHLIN